MSKKPELPPLITLEDFYAYMPEHKYIFAPDGALWPAASIDARLPAVPLVKDDGTPVVNKKGEPVLLDPHVWLDKHRAVEGMTWAPGEGEVICDRLPKKGGWITRPGVHTFNRYRPPPPRRGNARGAKRWIELVEKLYPDDVGHFISYCAHPVQRPGVKINHGVVMAGAPGIGKDTLLEPLRHGVGAENFTDASPHDVLGPYNDFMQAVVTRISEIKDQGDINRYGLYEKMKTILAAPPEMTRINIKYIPQFYMPNVVAAFITTNHQFDGLYLPPDDRRHYVMSTEVTKEDFAEGYWPELWAWYHKCGFDDVVAYLAERDLSKFNPKAPPKQTAAFWQMVGAGMPTEASELGDVLEQLGGMEDPPARDKDDKPCGPPAVTLQLIESKAEHTLSEWLRDRKNRRSIPHRLMTCGYLTVLTDKHNGLWIINGRRQAVYGRRDLKPDARFKAAEALKQRLEKEVADNVERLKTVKERADEKRRKAEKP